tara:strand:- start:93 stop:437 length:345 start_codon:yes stop_codon:yes gene_type:complete
MKYIMHKLYISILEGLYLLYMFNYFETKKDFNWLKYDWGNKFMKHLNGNVYGLRICPFGRIAILFLIALLLLRNNINKIYILYAIYIAFVLSLLLNWNALVYLIPVFIIEKLIF